MFEETQFPSGHEFRRPKVDTLYDVFVNIRDDEGEHVIETAGLRTTAGYIPLKDYVPKADATVVGKLKAAGAIILGKTNMAELAADYQSINLYPSPWLECH